MVKLNWVTVVKHLFLSLLLAASVAAAQSDADRERRLAELERKVKELDPNFSPAPGGVDDRLSALEWRVDELLAARTIEARTTTTAAASAGNAPAAPALEAQTTSEGQASGDEETRLPVAGYMDFHFNKNRAEPGQLDFHRFVLLFGHSFSDRIKFWSELEVEHALVEGREEKGEVELEQAYLDFLIQPYFNLRAGMLLAPVGILNERHEPPSFNGVERNQVETFIIPTTWFDTGFGFTGELGRGFRYRAYLMSGLDATGFSAEEGLSGGRQKGFLSSFRNPAKTARVEFQGVRRLTLGLSLYSGHTGFRLRTLNPRADIVSFDGRYSRGRLDLRGLFADVWISRARELNLALQREFGAFPNIARKLRGYYFEPAVHVLPRRTRHDLVLFTRYEKFNTQHRMPEGFAALPQFNRSAWVAGATYKPNADVAFKFDYIFNRNASSVVRAVDSVNLGLGWWF
jgi:hypothetical protein